jgi:hypothetical protein
MLMNPYDFFSGSRGRQSLIPEWKQSLAQECWIELTKENLLDAWDLEEVLNNWIGDTEFADHEGAENDVTFDTEFSHDDVDMSDIMLVDERDVSADNNNEWEG